MQALGRTARAVPTTNHTTTAATSRKLIEVPELPLVPRVVRQHSHSGVVEDAQLTVHVLEDTALAAGVLHRPMGLRTFMRTSVTIQHEADGAEAD